MSLFTQVVEGPRRDLPDGSRPAARGMSPERKVYEVHEFERASPDTNLVPVRHYRTVYHADGRISTEDLAVQGAWPAQ